MIRHQTVLKPVNYGKSPVKSQTIPDQSMSIHELVRRFVRGIPADVVQRKPIYTDSDVDLEQLSRLDSTDKAYYAAQMKAENEANASEFERERAERKRESEERQRADQEAENASSGIGSLDNTMPDDTQQKINELGVAKSTKKK